MYGRSMTPEENKRVVQEFYDQWSAGAIDFARLVDAAVVNHQPDQEPEAGLENFQRAIAGVMRAVPDSNWATLRLIADGDFVVCHNRWSGTYQGSAFRGVPTTAGHHFSIEHVHIYRLVDGRIAEHWVVRDDLGMMMQLRAVAAE
jgi:predicted ester cyclase